MSKISAIITCFNVQEYIATAMQSIIDVGIDDLELIVVDDCSIDRTRTIVDTVARNLPDNVSFNPVYFSKNTVGGVASAGNAGLDMATGDVVVFIDGDDWVIPYNLKGALEQHLSGGYDFTVCDCLEYWNDTGKFTQYPEGHYWEQLPSLTNIRARRDTLLKMAPFPWRKIYSRGFLERHKIRFPVGDFFFEDNPFHWETTVKAETFDFYYRPTHVHRMARSGQTVSAKGTKYIKIFDHATIIREKLEQSGALEANRDLYLEWLFKHIIWCANHVPAGFLNEVFERAQQHVCPLSPDVFWHAIAISGFDPSNVRKMAAIYLDERFEFFREF
ncbi:glycosyltransferase family 2 protein [Shimia aestuarii]|uniref:Glycosyltransferase involved in cell wall bisynthesis n=1 Tax=Shimia aestuarii TaxID=254406 RepID=A0A1I4TX33_9RHOB|nr:glycosyltransferase family 2 protein [Shimia aestuarii]SFM81103.1 Glycosyltransferase involved in cell wall bisynthesis [Shimia aestuarii]